MTTLRVPQISVQRLNVLGLILLIFSVKTNHIWYATICTIAVGEGWNAESFLNNVCIKAGLAQHTWKVHDVSLYKFTIQVFREKEPMGDVEEVILK